MSDTSLSSSSSTSRASTPSTAGSANYLAAGVSTLRGRLLKRHRTSRGWGKRIVEVDDELGLFFIYNSDTDRQRKTPAHLYALSEFESVAEEPNNAVSHCFSCQLRNEPKPFIYGCSSALDRNVWVDGLRARMAIARERGASQLQVGPLPGDWSATDLLLSNWADQPIGVVIDGLSKASPLAQAGLAGGDVIISVDGQACLSHAHASQLLGQSTQIRVVVPKGLNPGDSFPFKTPSGPVDVVVPPTAKAGSTISVNVPSTSSAQNTLCLIVWQPGLVERYTNSKREQGGAAGGPSMPRAYRPDEEGETGNDDTDNEVEVQEDAVSVM